MKKIAFITNSYLLLSFFKLLLIIITSLVVAGFWEEQIKKNNFDPDSVTLQMIVIRNVPYVISLLILFLLRKRIELKNSIYLIFSLIGFFIFYFLDFRDIRDILFFIDNSKIKLYVGTLLLLILLYFNLRFLSKSFKKGSVIN